MKRTVAVLVDAPIPGKVQTKLCPPLDAESAARIHESFICDTLERISSIPDAEIVIYYNQPGALSILSKVALDSKQYLRQKGKSTEQKIHYCFERLCEPHRGVIFTWTNSPTLPVRSFELAFDALASGEIDIVLGPADDGGCYLIGSICSNHNRVCGIESSALHNVQNAIENAARLGLRWYLLPNWYVVRQPESLYRLKNEVLEMPNKCYVPNRTKSCILELVDRHII